MYTVNKLSIVIPVYNSETTIGPLVDHVIDFLAPRYESLEIILVNDGSRDGSHGACVGASERHKGIVKYIRLARNFGEHNAVMCGMNFVTGDCVAIIDDDFQNEPQEIIKLVEKYKEGYDVVYSYYEEKKHSHFRNLGSAFNDWVATKVIRKPKNLYLSSFKVIGAPLVKDIINNDSPFPYIDGIILRNTNKIGTQKTGHSARKEGKSSYTLTKLISLWLNMFTGYSIVPLRFASLLGIAVSAISVLMIIALIVVKLHGGILYAHDIPIGWTSQVIITVFFSGLNLCMLGLIGEYLGRLSMTVNKIPQFVVRETFGVKKDG